MREMLAPLWSTNRGVDVAPLGLVRQQMADLSSADWMDGVVPVTVKPMGREPEAGELLIGDGAALRIGPAIQLAPHAQAGGRPRGADQVDDHGQTHERLPAPVGADVGEQPVLDLVPLAGTGRGVEPITAKDGDGELRPGMAAHVVVFDAAQIADRVTYEAGCLLA